MHYFSILFWSRTP